MPEWLDDGWQLGEFALAIFATPIGIALVVASLLM
jgi:hypothetical protein